VSATVNAVMLNRDSHLLVFIEQSHVDHEKVLWS
jgi:hypothetical protein